MAFLLNRYKIQCFAIFPENAALDLSQGSVLAGAECVRISELIMVVSLLGNLSCAAQHIRLAGEQNDVIYIIVARLNARVRNGITDVVHNGRIGTA